MLEFPSRHEILKLFEQDPQRTFRLRELVLEFGLRSSQARELKGVLKDLARSKKLVYLKKNHYALVHKGRYAAPETPGRSIPPLRPLKSPNLVSGRLIGHRDGYGFVVPDVPLAGTDLDIFIPPDGMGSALHGDRVEVHVQRSTKGFKGAGRMEGRIIQVTERAQKTVVGQFHLGPRYNYVMPFDKRIPCEIVIPRGQEFPEAEAGFPKLPGQVGPTLENIQEAGFPTSSGQVSATQGNVKPTLSRHRQFGGESEGRSALAQASRRQSVRDLDEMIVDVEITDYPRLTALPRGRVMEILGRREDFGVDVEIIIRKFHLPHRFPRRSAGGSRRRTAVHSRARSRRRDRVTFALCPSSPLTARRPRILTTPCMWSAWPRAITCSTFTSPTWPTTSGPARRLTVKRACGAPASIFPTAPCPCCRWSFPTASAA
jgi:ribonuclease R